MHEFNKEAIVEQRESKEAANNLLYWTNKKIQQWLNQIDLQVKTQELICVHAYMCICMCLYICVHAYVHVCMLHEL